MKQINPLHPPLYVFLVIGLICWGLAFILLPASPTYSFGTTTLLFVLVSFILYFLGYFISKKYYKVGLVSSNSFITSKTLVWVLIGLIIISWLIRYVDVFYNRGVTFSNSIEENRALFGSAEINYIYVFGSIFKELYFVPLLIVLYGFKEDKKLLWLCGLLYTFPLIIPFLRGTRKDIFLTFIILVIVLFLTKTITLKLRTILKVVVVFLFLNIVFYNILMKRETPQGTSENQQIEKILDHAIYNDLLQPTLNYKEKIKSSEGITKAVLFNYVHVLQYYCHGIFELDYLVKDKIKNQNFLNGEYNFYLFKKVFAKLGIIDYDSTRIHFILPRKSTYITFLGALFVDFGWISVLGMFVLGFFQNVIDKKVKNNNYLFLGLYVFFIVFNLLFPVINLLRGTGTYFVFASMLIIICYNILIRFKFRAYL